MRRIIAALCVTAAILIAPGCSSGLTLKTENPPEETLHKESMPTEEVSLAERSEPYSRVGDVITYSVPQKSACRNKFPPVTEALDAEGAYVFRGVEYDLYSMDMVYALSVYEHHFCIDASALSPLAATGDGRYIYGFDEDDASVMLLIPYKEVPSFSLCFIKKDWDWSSENISFLHDGADVSEDEAVFCQSVLRCHTETNAGEMCVLLDGDTESHCIEILFEDYPGLTYLLEYFACDGDEDSIFLYNLPDGYPIKCRNINYTTIRNQ